MKSMTLGDFRQATNQLDDEIKLFINVGHPKSETGADDVCNTSQWEIHDIKAGESITCFVPYEKELNPDDDAARVLKAALNEFQEVLNWCHDIEDDCSRLPLSLLESATVAINAATIRFQPEAVKK